MFGLTSRGEYLVAELVARRYDYVRFAILDCLRGLYGEGSSNNSSYALQNDGAGRRPAGSTWKAQQIVTVILNDLDQLPDGAALKVPLDELADGKANVRSALNRASRKAGRIVATATDENFLYV